MKTKLKTKLFLATIAAGACVGAHAATYTLADTDPGAGAAFSFTGTNLGSSFSDTLNFTFGDAPAWNASGSAQGDFYGLKLGRLVLGQGLTSLTVQIFGSTYNDVLGAFAVGKDTVSIDIPMTTVAAGSYSAIVSGKTVDTWLIPGKPSYSFSLVAAPVPEPGTWAMMIAGLGAIGLIARRRTRGRA